MTYPPIFEKADTPAVRALLKSGKEPLRFYLFGLAPQGVKYPYAVWRIISGSPENYLGDVPDCDSVTTQIDVYASPDQGAAVARSVATAIRESIQDSCYVTSFRGESRDPDTMSWSSGFAASWIVDG